jgi:hypothetical protein
VAGDELEELMAEASVAAREEGVSVAPPLFPFQEAAYEYALLNVTLIVPVS